MAVSIFSSQNLSVNHLIYHGQKEFLEKKLAAYHLNGIHMFKNNFNLLKEILLGSVISMIKIPFKQYHEDTSPLLNGEEVIWNNSGIKINGKSGFFSSIGISMEYIKYPSSCLDKTILCPFLGFLE